MRLKLLAVQVQAVMNLIPNDCLSQPSMMKAILISLGWIPPAQVLLTTTFHSQQSDSFEQGHLQETVVQTKEYRLQTSSE